jgi:hypothetical protein
MKPLLVGVCLFLALGPPLPVYGSDGDSQPSLDGLAWLAGCWGAEDSRGWAEECWLAPRGGVMLGVHRDVAPSGQVFFEFLRIEARADGVFYLASPKGRPPTPFELVGHEGRSATFENAEHDFPQRIRYSLDGVGPVLRVRIGTIDGEAESTEWNWTRRPAREDW